MSDPYANESPAPSWELIAGLGLYGLGVLLGAVSSYLESGGRL